MGRQPIIKQATIYDVADLAGVSHITVSRVVNGKQNVSPETRERVQKAMQELGYVQNPIAQTLQTRRSRTIELITLDVWANDSSNLASISSVAQKYNYQLTIIPTLPERVYDVLAAIPNRMAAGSILYGQTLDLDYRAIQQIVRQFPFVHMSGKLQSGLPSVVYDTAYGVQLALHHLIDLGHERIAFIGGQQGILDGQVRYETYLDFMAEHQLKPGPVAFGDFGVDSGESATRFLLESGEPFTAIFICSDSMALSALYVLVQAGLRVPEDVSLVGYNNERIAPYMFPPLTTIVNDFGVLGDVTAEYLFEFMENPNTARQQRVLLPELVVRASTLPPRETA